MTSDIFNDLKLALIGGRLPINLITHNIIKNIRELTPRHDRGEGKDDLIDDLISYLYDKYYTNKWINQYDATKSKWSTFITQKVYYAMLDYRRNIIKHNGYYEEEFKNINKIPNRELTGIIDEDYLMFKNSEAGYDNDTPESYYDASILYDIILSTLGEEIGLLAIQGYSQKQIAEKLNVDYRKFNRTNKSLYQALGNKLTELGYDIGEIHCWQR